MASGNYPAKYLLFNKQLSKQLAIVMIIEGVPYTFGISDTYEEVKWGALGLFWGLPGLVWGGLKKIGGLNGVGGVKPYIVLDPSMTIQQRIEPEQGKGNIGTLSMTLIDYKGEVSFMIAPGNVVDEIMCSKQTTIYVGFQQTSFPQDYVILYRGYITSLDCPPGLVRFQLSDATMKSRQPICDTPTTNTTNQLVANEYIFVVGSANATIGTSYKNNNQSFTVLATIAGGTTLLTEGTGDPTPNGTLTVDSGPGDATIAFSSFTLTSQTVIDVLNTQGFYTQIMGPDGTYSSTVHTFLKIDDEIMEYDIDGIVDENTFSVTRGSLGTIPADHDIDTQVTNTLQLGFDQVGQGLNFMTAALQLLLSGWNGPCETDIDLNSLGLLPDPTTWNYFILGFESGLQIDSDLTLGLTVGDYYYVTGATDPSNNISGLITGFVTDANNYISIVMIDQSFNSFEFPTDAVCAFRSKYDVLPVAAGSQCRMRDVDVSTWETIRKNYFLSSIYDICMYYDAPLFATDTIVADLMLPMGCYSISRYGRISVSITKPPLPGSGKQLVQLDYTNIIDPDQIHVTRATNNRTFYNQVSYEYDFRPADGTYSSIQYFIDTNSLNLFSQTLTLPIQATALKTTLGAAVVAGQRGAALLTRYKNVALILELTVNWSVGSLIEVSDVVLIVDNGKLQIMNFQTGQRNLGSQLFEVIDRSYNVTQGNVKLKVLSGLGFNVNSRFGLISPSTIIAAGSTSTVLRVTPSYGQVSISAELQKWTPYFGLPIVVHSADYSVSGMATLQSMNALDPTALNITDLGFTPTAGYVMEIAPYPTTTNKMENSQYKALYCYQTPTLPVASGTSTTVFDMTSTGDADLMTVGNIIILRKLDYTVYSQEVTIQSIVGTVITVATALRSIDTNAPFTPDDTFVVEGIGFKDGLGYYRYD